MIDTIITAVIGFSGGAITAALIIRPHIQKGRDAKWDARAERDAEKARVTSLKADMAALQEQRDGFRKAGEVLSAKVVQVSRETSRFRALAMDLIEYLQPQKNGTAKKATRMIMDVLTEDK